MRECETAVITACMHGQARRRRGPTPLDGSEASSAPGCPAHPSDGVAPAPASGWRNGPNALYASHFWPLFRPSVRPPLPSENVITRAFDALSFIALRRGRQACIHSYAHTQAEKPTISSLMFEAELFKNFRVHQNASLIQYEEGKKNVYILRRNKEPPSELPPSPWCKSSS